MSAPRSLELPAGVESMRVETDRGSFAAHVSRPSEPTAHVLLVPGWTGSKEDFTPIVALLGDAGFAATAYDQRGQFETPGAPGDDYSLRALAEDALAVATAVTDSPVHLLGHSFGGLVAQTAAVEAPAAWRSLSLLCTGPAALGETDLHPLAKMVEALDHLPLERVHELREQARPPGERPPAEIADFLHRRFTSNTPASLRAMTRHLLDAPDRVEEVARTGLPVWVGRGVDDDAWPHDRQADMAHRLGVEVHVVPGSAHSPAVENPEELVAVWVPFLEGV
ncbi:alpha/beta fold hydrolase [Aeromicrobium sp. CTD01-1L150]|uniref:alpha/beta fold hydrolase n=1 Tax=Aeromicrobium sp. CTD01-1L150 TaxID=3341830 RepID=UPI0035C06B92